MSKVRLFTFGRLFCLMFVVALLSACGSKIFYATFQSDTVGSLPNENPPEDPTGDLIYTSGGTFASSQLAVVNNNILNSKSLKYNNANVETFYRFVGFVSKETSLAPEPKFGAYWNGVIDLDNSGSGLQIWLGDSHFVPIALLEFKNGNIRLQTSTGSSPTFENLGPYVEGVNHTIFISVHKANGTYGITVDQPGVGNDISTGSRNVLNIAALNTQRPTLYMWFKEEKSGSGFYMIDDVVIKKKDPSS